MINRAVQLWCCIEKFYSTKFSKENDFPTGDNLLEVNWEKLEIFKNLLHPFYQLTMRLQGNSRTGSHGSAWEYIVAIDIIRKHLRKVKAEHLKGCYTRFLGMAINTGLNLAQKYDKLVTELPKILFMPPQLFLTQRKNGIILMLSGRRKKNVCKLLATKRHYTIHELYNRAVFCLRFLSHLLLGKSLLISLINSLLRIATSN